MKNDTFYNLPSTIIEYSLHNIVTPFIHNRKITFLAEIAMVKCFCFCKVIGTMHEGTSIPKHDESLIIIENDNRKGFCSTFPPMFDRRSATFSKLRSSVFAGRICTEFLPQSTAVFVCWSYDRKG